MVRREVGMCMSVGVGAHLSGQLSYTVAGVVEVPAEGEDLRLCRRRRRGRFPVSRDGEPSSLFALFLAHWRWRTLSATHGCGIDSFDMDETYARKNPATVGESYPRER